MRKAQLLLLLFFTIAYASVYAQLSDIARVEYTLIPGGNSDIEYNRTRALFNFPIKLKKEGSYLLLGLDFSIINLIMNENNSLYEDELDDFKLLDVNIGYTTPLKNDWRLGFRVTPGLSSNLSSSEVDFNDVVLSSDLVFIKDKTKDTSIEKPWRLIFGISYSGNRGFRFPLPFISYYKKFEKNWSYNFGIPNTNLQYHISKTHRLKLFAELDGFTSNIQRGVVIDNDNTIESINMSLILSGLQYELHIINHLQYFIKTGFILSNSVQLRNQNKDNIEELDDTNQFYLRTGLRLKI